MTLARGDLLAKIDPATGKPVEDQVYTRFRIAELSPTLSLPNVASVEGQTDALPPDVYQVVLLKKEA